MSGAPDIGGGQLRNGLTIRLAAFPQKNPDAAQQVQDLADRVKGADNGEGARTRGRGNTSQVVISGGAISASGGIHYRAPEGSR
ncbi:hypothetical protein [Streptomyces acidiscabies]|uniref:hypothetical protein n=1 Tax=Streptomyces acidiscabies TaxID=42234 RepID=UPI0038F5E562